MLSHKIKLKLKLKSNLLPVKPTQWTPISKYEYLIDGVCTHNATQTTDRRSPVYIDFIRSVFSQLLSSVPNLAKSLSELFTSVDPKIASNSAKFDILTGAVQSGKTLPLIMFLWNQKFVLMNLIMFITANRNAVRKDFITDIGKFNTSLLLKAISTVLMASNNQLRQQITSEISTDYLVGSLLQRLTLIPLDPMDKKKGNKALLNPTANLLTGHFMVFIQNTRNIRAALKYYSQARKSRCLSVVIDEIHRMYTDGKDDQIHQGVRADTKLNLATLIDIFNAESQPDPTNSKSIPNVHLVGITATPIRVMADPTVKINAHHQYVSDGYSGLEYLGPQHFRKSTLGLGLVGGQRNPIKFHYMNGYEPSDIQQQIAMMLARPNLTLTHMGQTLPVQKLIGINVSRTNDAQEKIANELNRVFAGQLVALSVNQHTFTRQCPSISSYLSLCPMDLPIVLVGSAYFDMASKIKPSENTRLSNGRLLVGLTDYLISTSKDANGELLEQQMRPFGYYLPGFECHYHLTHESFQRIKSALDFNREVISKYKAKSGVDSIRTIAYEGQFIKPAPNVTYTETDYSRNSSLFPKMIRDTLDSVYIDYNQLAPNRVIKCGHKTRFVNLAVEYPQLWQNLHLSQYTTYGDLSGHASIQNQLREVICRDFLGLTQGIDRVQGAYDDGRYKGLVSASVFPKKATKANKESAWQVNVLIGNPTCPLTHIPVTIFDMDWSDPVRQGRAGIYYLFQHGDEIIVNYKESIMCSQRITMELKQRDLIDHSHQNKNNIAKILSLI
jgi:hypothetical protein